MKLKMSIKVTSRELKTIVLLFILLFFSNDTYLFGTNSNELMVAIPRYLMLVFCAVSILLLIVRKKYKVHKDIVGLYIFMIIVLAAVSFYHHEHFSRVFIKIVCITTGMLVCMQYDIEEYSNAFLKCTALFSVVAILLTTLAYVAPSIVRALPSVVNTVGVRFYSVGLAGLDERSLSTWNVRTGGIFWEPGVFQMYLNFAILLELFINHSPNKKRMAIFILADILTFSTTGYLALAWIIVTFALFGRDNNRSTTKNIAIFFGLIVATLAAYFLVFYTTLGSAVFGKLFDMKDGSTMVRQASILVNFEIIREHPFVGIGMDVMADEFERRSYLSSAIYGWTRQNTNTLLYQFAAHGCLFGIPFTWGTYKFGGKLSNKLFMKISIFVMFLMLYIGENLMTSIFPYIIIFYGADKAVNSKRAKYYKELVKRQ